MKFSIQETSIDPSSFVAKISLNNRMEYRQKKLTKDSLFDMRLEVGVLFRRGFFALKQQPILTAMGKCCGKTNQIPIINKIQKYQGKGKVHPFNSNAKKNRRNKLELYCKTTTQDIIKIGNNCSLCRKRDHFVRNPS